MLMINILKKIIHYTRNNFQTKSSSYLKHNLQYNEKDALDKTKKLVTIKTIKMILLIVMSTRLMNISRNMEI